MKRPNGFPRLGGCWRQALVVLSVVAPLLLLFSKPRIPQPQEYFDFADQRALLGIPNFLDVATNLAFLVVGIAGLTLCLKNRWGGMRPAWIALFVGVASVGLGSGYFHWYPSDDTLVWDRVPMTVGFTGFFVAVLGEYVSVRLGRLLLVPALFLGAASVLYWYGFDDLRLYLWVQGMPLLAIPVVMLLFRSGYSHQGFIVAALGCYGLAKVAEVGDQAIFAFTQRLVSGHSLKHLLAALGCYALVATLKSRRPLGA